VARRPAVNLNEVPSIAVGSDRRKSAKDESAQSGVGRFRSAPDLHPQQCSKHDGGSHRELDAPGSSTYEVVAGAWRITIDVGSAASTAVAMLAQWDRD